MDAPHSSSDDLPDKIALEPSVSPLAQLQLAWMTHRRPKGRVPRLFQPLDTSLLDSLAKTVRNVAIPPAFEAWIDQFVAVPDKKPRKRQPGVRSPRCSLIIYALIAAQILRQSAGIESLAALRWRWPRFVPDCRWLDDLHQRYDFSQLHQFVHQHLTARLGRSLVDPLQLLYEQLLGPAIRRQLGEVYTPDWLADHIVGLAQRNVTPADAPTTVPPSTTWLDPTVGSGSMLFALARSVAVEAPLPHFVGFDNNPWAILAVAANYAFIHRWRANRGHAAPMGDLPFARLDMLGAVPDPKLEPQHPIHQCAQTDVIVGNPPWILWDQLPPSQRSRQSELWNRYGLLAESGMRSILGGGKKDLAMLIVPLAADRFLKAGGTLSMVIPLSLLRSSSSGRGLRRWELPGGEPLEIQRADDFAKVNVFRTASVKAGAILLRKGSRTNYPVPYFDWNLSSPALTPTRPKEPGEMAELPRSFLIGTPLAASPSDARDPLSAWRTTSRGDGDEPSVDSVWGQSDYSAHLGANTGGANGVYWFEKLGESTTPGCWTVRNLPEHSKRLIARRTAAIETRLLYPLLLASDVRPWAVRPPSKWILLVQDPQRRRGLTGDELRQTAPATVRYLRLFEAELRERKAFLRYFTRRNKDGTVRETGEFYSMFDIGPYSMAPFKVVWNRMGSRLSAAVVGSIDGKQVQPQETVAYIAVETVEEADYLAALLNSGPVKRVLAERGATGTKSFATPRAIDHLRLRRFDPQIALHEEISELGQRHRLRAESGQDMSSHGQQELDELAAEYWQLRTERQLRTEQQLRLGSGSSRSDSS